MHPHNAKYYGHITLPSQETLDKLLSKVKLRIYRHKGAVFLSSIISNTDFEWDETIPTAATNGKVIKWNPYFFYSIPTEERVFVMAHEVWHIAYQHVIRRGNRDPLLFNIAGDHVINNLLINEGFSVKNLGFKVYQDPKYHGWSVDRVYEDLMVTPPPPKATGGKGGTPEPEGEGTGDQSDAGEKPNLHHDIEEADSLDKLDIAKTIVQAVQASKMAGEAGVIPGEVEEAIEQLLNPIVPWETVIQQFLTELSNDDYSYRRPSRRYEDIILPTLYNEGALQEMNWYVDVSGSISSHNLHRFFSEMKYVHETFKPVKINIIQFDTRVSKVDVLDNETDFKVFNVVGRGGTNLFAVKKHIEETKPVAAIVFSDMECDPIPDMNMPFLWCIFKPQRGDGHGHKPTWGQVVDVRDNE